MVHLPDPARAVLLCAALLCGAATSRAQADSNRQLTIASWNLQHLATEDGKGCKPRQQRDYSVIKSVMSARPADVWLFQEVESAAALSRVLDVSEWSVYVENRPDVPSEGDCDVGGNSMTMQRAIIAVRKSIPHARNPDLAFLDVNGSGYLRHGVSVSLSRGKAALEIINVHLKAGCQEGAEGEACPTLFLQSVLLSSYAAERTASGSGLIIGGDFNRQLAAQGDEVWRTFGFNPKTGLELTWPAGLIECGNYRNQPIDFIVTSQAAREIVDLEAAEVDDLWRLREAMPSDHCPLFARFSFAF